MNISNTEYQTVGYLGLEAENVRNGAVVDNNAESIRWLRGQIKIPNRNVCFLVIPSIL